MVNLIEKIKETSEYLAKQGIRKPAIGIVLGTGLGALATKIEDATSIPYSSIPNFAVSTVEFHKGQLIYGNIGGTTVLLLCRGAITTMKGIRCNKLLFQLE